MSNAQAVFVDKHGLPSASSQSLEILLEAASTTSGGILLPGSAPRIGSTSLAQAKRNSWRRRLQRRSKGFGSTGASKKLINENSELICFLFQLIARNQIPYFDIVTIQ